MNQQATVAPQQDAEVIIVGGGPVGMGLAIELGQRGVSVIVVERYVPVSYTHLTLPTTPYV